jgi:O-antigen/teichoic acid export membrane protein
MATTVVSSVLGYVYWIVAARTYSARDVGLVAALISAMTLASNLSNLGIGSALVQTLPRRSSGRTWSLTLNAGLITGTGTGLFAGLAVVAALPLVSPQFAVLRQSPAFAIALVAGVPLWTLATLLDQAFVAERSAGAMLVRNAFFSLLKIALLVLPGLLAATSSLGIFASWVIGSGIASCAAMLWLVPRLARGYRLTIHGLRPELRSMRSLFAGHHLINLGGMAPVYLLPMLVTAELSPADNAYFYTTWMLGSLFFMVSPAVSSSLFAEGSHARDDVGRKARLSAAIIGTLMAPIMLIFFLAGGRIIAVFGPTFPRHGLSLLMILTVAAVPDAITNVYVSVLRIQGRLRRAAVLNVGMALSCLALACVLLPRLGIAGAGWSWLSAQVLGSLVVGVDMLAMRLRRQSKTQRQDSATALSYSDAPVKKSA